MVTARQHPHGPEAYSADGVTLWWELQFWPGTRKEYGAERKTAAWLACAKGVGAVFTMRDVRAALGEGGDPNDDEHLNRRLRTLRQWGWRIDSARADGTLKHNQYRVREIGWHPAVSPSPPKSSKPSARTRRVVFERDGRTCVVCGVAGGEPYVDDPEQAAQLTIGHRVPGNRATAATDVDDLQTECARCNETVRDELPDPLTLAELLPAVRRLPRQQKASLLSWLRAGHRQATAVDRVYADVRQLTPVERGQLITELCTMVGS